MSRTHRVRPSLWSRARLLLVAICLTLLGWVAPAAACKVPGMVSVGARPTPTSDKSDDSRLQAFLAAHKGQPVLINFWASWCEPCRAEMAGLQRLSQRWQGRGLAVVTVAVADKPQRVEAFLRDVAVDLPVIDDEAQTLSRQWGAVTLPTTLILDHRHRIRRRAVGVIDWDAHAVDHTIRTLFQSARSPS